MQLKTICAVALVTALGAFGATPVQANVCSVPTDYPTIQSAASDPSCSKIKVAPGIYSENVTVTHSCKIEGAQAHTPVSGRTAGSDAESWVYATSETPNLAVFTIAAPEVIIDGFSISEFVPAGGAAYGVIVSGSGSDAAILNNIFDIFPHQFPGADATAQAVYLTGGPDNVNIQDNEIKRVFSYGSAAGVLIGDNGGTDPSQNVQIKGNWIHLISSFRQGAYAVRVADVADVSGLKIISNRIENIAALFLGCWVRAIGLEGDTPGVEVKDNYFRYLDTGNDDRKAVWFENNPSFGTANVHQNNFDLTAYIFGIAVDPSLTGGSVDGTCNWWNSPTGPTTPTNPGGTGTKVSPNVSYSPWLTSVGPNASCHAPATAAAQCKSGGWMTKIRADGSTFNNQGDCIRYVATGN